MELLDRDSSLLLKKNGMRVQQVACHLLAMQRDICIVIDAGGGNGDRTERVGSGGSAGCGGGWGGICA